MKIHRFSIAIYIVICLILPINTMAKDAQAIYTVFVDAGHGGKDSGVSLKGDTLEKDVTLNLALSLRSHLDHSKNIRTLLSRSSDLDLSLKQRLARAKAERVDLFISLHVNAGFDKTASGFEMYYPGFKNPSQTSNDSNEIVRDMVQTKSLNESIRFAKILQKNLSQVFPRKDRDLREGPIVLQGMTAPSLVVEIGFATNSKERKLLTDPAIQKAVVEAIDSSIREYFASQRP